MDLNKILQASEILKSVVTKTPFLKSINLSKKYDCNIYLKREDLQIVRSFKIRGAYNKMASLSAEQTKFGVVCASAGNHAQGVAFACAALEIRGTIFMPTTTPNQKISKVRHFGGQWVQIELTGDTFDDAQNHAYKFAEVNQITFVHPFNDNEVIAGQATVAVEMMDDIDVTLDYLLVAVGGGGLISGVGTYFKKVSPHTKIIAIESEGAPALYNSLKDDKLVLLDKIDSFADGIAVKAIGTLTFEYCKKIIDDIVLVPEGKICSAMLNLYNDEAIVTEPAGAISIAALDFLTDKIRGKNIAIIICGGNNDIARTEEIRERALLYEGKKHYFVIRFPQRAGALREFLNVLGPEDDISHFEYTKKNNRDSGPALVGIELKSKNDFESLVTRMKAQGINFEHLNNNPMLFEMLV